jgi:hypothetical protein
MGFIYGKANLLLPGPQDQVFNIRSKMRQLRILCNKLFYFLFFFGIVGCLYGMPMNSIEAAGSGAPVAFNHLGGSKGDSYWIRQYEPA